MKAELKQAVEKNKELIVHAYDYTWKHPETGYREVKTSKYLEEAFIKLGYEIIKAKVIDLHKFNTFEELYANFDKVTLGYENILTNTLETNRN